MADLVYTRVSTDEQSTQRQTHLLGEAGLTTGADGVRFFSDPATSSKILALQRAGFQELARYARQGTPSPSPSCTGCAGTWPTSSPSATGAGSAGSSFGCSPAL